jgi:3-oxoacyl-[acyl-carrier protein] reductase
MNGGNLMSLGPGSGHVVAIVTGGASPAGRSIAGGLARWAWPVVIVYLDHPSRVEATIAEIIAAGGTTIAVRADLTDDLDVQRLFTESIAEFGGVDVVVHTTSDSADLLCQHAARHVRQRGAIVVTATPRPIMPQAAAQLLDRSITIERVAPRAVHAYLDRWCQRNAG